MVTRPAAVALLVLVAAVPLSSELKYTAHLEVKKVDVPSPEPANPMLSMMGDALGQQLLPEGPIDLVFVVGEKGTRTEYSKAAMGQPAGSVLLGLPDGTVFVMNSKEQTYWKLNVETRTGALQAAGIKPMANAKRTGESDSVAGVRCERILIDLHIDLPIPDSLKSSLPPGFPTSLAMDGESCLSVDRYQKYVDLTTKTKGLGDFMSAMGLDKLTQGGIVMRQVVRLSGVQLESVVTSIGEEDVPPTMFTIPADYKEVPPPAPIK